jgi:type I site-specific restriction-modification system R (restriction) subunit
MEVLSPLARKDEDLTARLQREAAERRASEQRQRENLRKQLEARRESASAAQQHALRKHREEQEQAVKRELARQTAKEERLRRQNAKHEEARETRRHASETAKAAVAKKNLDSNVKKLQKELKKTSDPKVRKELGRALGTARSSQKQADKALKNLRKKK